MPSNKRHVPRHRLVYFSNLVFHVFVVAAYHRQPCTRQAAAQFSFNDCYLPPMNPDLALSQASFVLAHDAATGYIHKNHLSPDGVTWSYTKTQSGTLYQQLQDGARALDLRPKLLHNGTVVFHHGLITVPISFTSALEHVLQWCRENPKEIVLLLSSHYTFGKAHSSSLTTTTTNNDDDAYSDDTNDDDMYSSQTDKNSAMVNALQEIYNQYGVLYLSCADVYEWTVSTVQEQASLPNNGGILLALDGKDVYPGRFCGKENYIESQIVPCWTNGTSCKTSSVPYERLQDYILASANNAPTDDTNQLGPPNNLYRYPLNEIQALWQVTAASAAIGLAHLSNILADDQASQLHKKLISLIHHESMPGSISLLAVDNVALYGNALTSILRNRCGQSILGDDNDVPCGPNLKPPRLQYWHVETKVVLSLALGVYVVVMTVVFFRKRPHLIQAMRNAVHPLVSSSTDGPISSTTRAAVLAKDSKAETLISQHPQSVLI